MTIKEMNPGDSGIVVGYQNADKKYLNKIMAMGLTRGVSFRFVKKAPLGDPAEIEVRGFRLSLRKDEADVILVKSTK